MRSPVARLREATGGASTTPLLVLFVLNFVDELDQVTYGVVAPNIRDTFGVSESTVVTVGALSAALVIMLVVPVGYLADRRNRLQLVSVAALAWGSMSVLTGISGFVGAFGLLAIARFGAGLGRVMNEPVHVSLLADYYPPVQHGRVYSFHRGANALGAAFVLVCGGLADLVGWRVAFVVLATPTFIAWIFLARLHEPVRGASLDLALATRAAANATKVPFRVAWRELKAIPSLKRTWMASFALGASIVPMAILLSFFFENEYNVTSITARSAITALYSVGSLVGLRIGSQLSTKALMQGDLPRLTTLAGVTLSALAVGFVGLALSPWIGASIFFVFTLGMGTCIQSFALPVMAAVAPPRLRSQALGYFVFFIGLGAAFVAPAVASLGEQVNYRIAISSLSVILVIAGAIFASARVFVRDDADRAFESFRRDAEAAPAIPTPPREG